MNRLLERPLGMAGLSGNLEYLTAVVVGLVGTDVKKLDALAEAGNRIIATEVQRNKDEEEQRDKDRKERMRTDIEKREKAVGEICLANLVPIVDGVRRAWNEMIVSKDKLFEYNTNEFLIHDATKWTGDYEKTRINIIRKYTTGFRVPWRIISKNKKDETTVYIEYEVS